ncbi:MAG: histidine kinase dimerization/phospho-acceptor domain-containing protein [Pseudomonadota bacterium]
MFFDDRLATVLRQEASTDASKRTQFRQLLDILGNRKFGPVGRRDQSLVAAAWLRMDALGASLPAAERAAIIREPSWRFRSADLAAHLSDFEPEVVSAALNRADLTAQEWTDLIPRLPIRARGFLRLRKDFPIDVELLLDQLGVMDRGLPSPTAGRPQNAPFSEDLDTAPTDDALEPLELDMGAILPPTDYADEPFEDVEIESGRSEISALVERIAEFRRTREAQDGSDPSDLERSPRLPLDEAEPVRTKRASGFAFATDAAGRIEWADTEVASMVVGRKLVPARTLGEATSMSALERALRQRQPIEATDIELEGAAAVAGAWSVDAQPRFSFEGHFTGYVGRFRRAMGSGDDDLDSGTQEADRIRQLLHELRTPITAVQGYAEVIQQQLFGPAPHEYRALAAAIAADAAFVLGGFDELDRLARLETGAAELDQGESDLASLARRIEAQLAPVLASREAALTIDVAADESVAVPMDSEDAERLVWRLLATLGGGCTPKETLNGHLRVGGDEARLVCDLPAALKKADDVFSATAKPEIAAITAGAFGAGFALRLARAEARAAGGDLVREGDCVALSLPVFRAAEDAGQPSQEATG